MNFKKKVRMKNKRVILCDYIIVLKIKRNFREKEYGYGREINKFLVFFVI